MTAHTGPARTVPIHFVQRTLRTARRSGVDVAELLRGAGIPADLARNDRARITVEQMTAVTQRFWRLADDELFGLGPTALPRGTFRMLSLALISAPDLRTLFVRWDEFSALLPGLPRTVVEFGDRTRMEIDVRALDDPEHLLTDLMLAVAHRFAGWLIGRRIALLSVELPYPRPAEVADYEQVFGCVPTFDAPRAAIGFDPTVLSAPILRTEDDLADYINNSPGDLLSRRDYGSTTADRVRRILQVGLRGQWPTSEMVASRLAISLQHLRRQLRDEGTSLSQIREEIVRDAAIASLVRGEEPVAELSERLGFSEPSAFRRAFRRWTGSPPGSYRPGGDDAVTEPGGPAR